MSLFICGNDSRYFYFYRFDASSPMVSSSLSPPPSGGKLDPPVRITLSNRVLRSYQVVNRLVPIVDALSVGKCRVTSTIGEQKSFPTIGLSYKISQALPILATSRRKSKLIVPSPPRGVCVGGGGVSGMVSIVCISELSDSICGERFFGRFVGYTWVVLDRNACQLVVTNVLTTCADVIITIIVTDCHLVAVYVLFVFVTDAILSSVFPWPSAWLDRTPISSYP